MVFCLDVDFLFCWLVFILDIGKIKQDVVWLLNIMPDILMCMNDFSYLAIFYAENNIYPFIDSYYARLCAKSLRALFFNYHNSFYRYYCYFHF